MRRVAGKRRATRKQASRKQASRRRWPRRVLRSCIAVLAGAILAVSSPVSASAQSLLERSPNLAGTWTGSSGVVYFNFMHRFRASNPPQRQVSNTPTFLLAAGVPGNVLVGARYATRSALVAGFPNEWEFFGRYGPLRQSAGSPLDVAVAGAYNQAVGGFDGSLTLARRLGPVRVLAVARGFGDASRELLRGEGVRAALGGGAAVRLTESVALAGDYAVALDSDEDATWSAGVHLRIPTTPHTLSLHASNAQTTLLRGASAGIGSTLWGFEFTVPITLSRYIGALSSPPPAPARDAGGAGDAAADGVVEITMTNRLTYSPETVRISAGDTVRWRNTSDLPHTVTADPAKAMDPANAQLPDGAEPFDSGDLAPGDVFTRAFDVPGTYVYFCIPHEAAAMVGTVVVTP